MSQPEEKERNCNRRTTCGQNSIQVHFTQFSYHSDRKHSNTDHFRDMSFLKLTVRTKPARHLYPAERKILSEQTIIYQTSRDDTRQGATDYYRCRRQADRRMPRPKYARTDRQTTPKHNAFVDHLQDEQ